MSRKLYKHIRRVTDVCVLNKEQYEYLDLQQKRLYRKRARKDSLPVVWEYSENDLRSQQLNEQP